MATPRGVAPWGTPGKGLRKAAAIEWYDFVLYTAAGLIFGKLYFPNQDLLTATLLAFGTYFIGQTLALVPGLLPSRASTAIVRRVERCHSRAGILHLC